MNSLPPSPFSNTDTAFPSWFSSWRKAPIRTPRPPLGSALLSGVLLGPPPPTLQLPYPQEPQPPRDAPGPTPRFRTLHTPAPAGATGLSGARTAPQHRPATRPPPAAPLPHMLQEARLARRMASGWRVRELTRACRATRELGDQGGAYTTPSGDATAEETTAVSASRAGQQLPPGPAPRRTPRRRRRRPQVPLGRARAAQAQVPPPRAAPPRPAPEPTQALACWRRRRGTGSWPYPPEVPGDARPRGEQREALPCGE